MELTPLIAVHLSAALGAVATGPVALWARQGRLQRPRLHRALGYAWVTLMLATAISAIFIRDYSLPNIAGYTPIHLTVPVVLLSLFWSFYKLAQGDIAAHRSVMRKLYIGACVVTGIFTLLPQRYLGKLLWSQWLGLLPGPGEASRSQGTSMPLQIITSTPPWVWALLAALMVLGLVQARTRSVGLGRTLLLPLSLGSFSLYGTVSAFGASLAVLGSWGTAMLLMLLAVTQMHLPAGVAYDAGSRRFHLPGSWVPMGLILGIFLTKYAVGVSLAMQPRLGADAGFALAAATLYGVFSGAFAGRALRLLRLALRPHARHAIPVTAALNV